MVMSKKVIDRRREEAERSALEFDPDVGNPMWFTMAGNERASTKRLKKAIVEELDRVGRRVSYPYLRRHLVAVLPDDADGLENRHVKELCGILAREGLVVER